MNRENINDATDKLNLIDDKLNFIMNVVMYVNHDMYYFTKTDLTGLGLILGDLQESVKEVKELLSCKI